jgi:para-nitrobenzyl esterase
VFGALPSKKLPWRDEDRKVSALMMDYWSNFAKTGDPNGPGLPKWPAYNRSAEKSVMHLSAEPRVTSDDHRARFEALVSAGPGVGPGR